MQLNSIFKGVSEVLSKNSPVILTSVAIAGVVTTSIFAARAGYASADVLWTEEGDNLTPTPLKRKIELTWQLYLPAIGVGAATIACMIGSTAISNRRQAALLSAYTITESAFKEYQAKIIETIGSGKEQKARDEIAQEYITNNPPDSKEIIITGNGDVLCLDALSGRYFMSEMEKIRKAVNDINEQLINHGYASQNDFYRLIGLPTTQYGEEFGWRSEKLLEIAYSSCLSPDNKPAIYMDYRTEPKRGYYKENYH